MPDPPDPDFLKQHVDRYYKLRVRDEWNGKHIINGLQPTPDDIVMMSNDYLAIADAAEIVQAECDVLKSSGHGTPQSRIFTNRIRNRYDQQSSRNRIRVVHHKQKKRRPKWRRFEPCQETYKATGMMTFDQVVQRCSEKLTSIRTT